jgi:hypothetical protein
MDLLVEKSVQCHRLVHDRVFTQREEWQQRKNAQHHQPQPQQKPEDRLNHGFNEGVDKDDVGSIHGGPILSSPSPNHNRNGNLISPCGTVPQPEGQDYDED